MVDELIVAPLGSVRDNLVSFVQGQLKNFHARVDYKELLTCTSLDILYVPPVNAPGALQRAWWVYQSINQSINQSIKLDIEPLQDTYSEALPAQPRLKRVVLNFPSI